MTSTKTEPLKEISFHSLAAFRKTKRSKKKDQMTAEEAVLKAAKAKQEMIVEERDRVKYFRQHHKAALCIQRAYKLFRMKNKGILKNARDAVRLKRLDAGELEWKKQIAACTIQLAWRQYARRHLKDALQRSGSHVIHNWDADMIALKQRSLMEAIYTEHLYAPAWHPSLERTERPYWHEQLPSPAALSFNWAINQYRQPLTLASISLDSTLNGRTGLDTINEINYKTEDSQYGVLEGAKRQSYFFSYNLGTNR